MLIPTETGTSLLGVASFYPGYGMVLRWYRITGGNVSPRLVGSKAAAMVTARTVSALAGLMDLCAQI